jgi:hypothetical protein
MEDICDEISALARGLDVTCPVGDISRCPLYIESHVGRGLGCVDDLALSCKVARSEMNISAAVQTLADSGIIHPGMLKLLNPIGRKQ